MPPVKEAALRLGLPVYQPERVRRPEVVEQLRAMAPEAMVVVGYGQIIPAGDSGYSAAGHHQRACVAAAEVSRSGADSVGHRARRNVHRRHHDADRRGSRHRRHAAEVGDSDRAGGNGSRVGRRGWRWRVRICWWRRWRSLDPDSARAAGSTQATYAPILKKKTARSIGSFRRGKF